MLFAFRLKSPRKQPYSSVKPEGRPSRRHKGRIQRGYATAKGEEQTSHSKVDAVTLHANVAEISTRRRQKEPRDVRRYRPGCRRREALTVSTP